MYLSIYLSTYLPTHPLHWHNQASSISIVSSPPNTDQKTSPIDPKHLLRRRHHSGVWRITGCGQDRGGWFDGAVESRLSWPRCSAWRSFCRGEGWNGWNVWNIMKWEGNGRDILCRHCHTVTLELFAQGLDMFGLLKDLGCWQKIDDMRQKHWAHRHHVTSRHTFWSCKACLGPSVPIEAHGWCGAWCLLWLRMWAAGSHGGLPTKCKVVGYVGWRIQLIHLSIFRWSFGCATCWSWNPWSKSTWRGAAFGFSRWPSMKLVFGSKQSLRSLCQCTGCITWTFKCWENVFSSIHFLWLLSSARWVWLEISMI